MNFELGVDQDGIFEGVSIILELKEHQKFDFSIKRKIHNEMLDYYYDKNWNKVITHCMELKGEFNGTLDHYYEAMKKRVFQLKLQELIEAA